MQLVDKKTYRQQLPLKKLGKEPFDIETEELYQLLHQTSLPIKTAFLTMRTIICSSLI